jgi:mono/diheme cytochrome c family protein
MRKLFFAIACIGCGLLGAQSPEIKKTTVTATSPTSGKEMYIQYCAACHGKDAKGDGPAATALKTAPTDLTKLSAKNGGKFPEAKVVRVIDGSDSVSAHGSRDMPIWGAVFHKMDINEATTKVRLSNLSAYLQSIQGK